MQTQSQLSDDVLAIHGMLTIDKRDSQRPLRRLMMQVIGFLPMQHVQN